MSADLSQNLIIKKSLYRDSISGNHLNTSFKQSLDNSERYKLDPKLTLDEIMVIIKAQFIKNCKEILKVLNSFDLENSGIVTKGELRRVLDLYCLPMTTTQYDSFLSHNSAVTSTGSVNYLELIANIQGFKDSQNQNQDAYTTFPVLKRSNTSICMQNISNKLPILSKVSSVNGLRSQLSSSQSSRSSTFRQSSRGWNYSSYNLDEIIPILQNQITRNPNAIMKAFKIFDFNFDNNIQKHRLRKVLDNFCCVLTDQQFEKLLLRFCPSESGSVNYLDLLKGMGIPINANGSIQFNKLANKEISIDTRISEETRIMKLAICSFGLISLSDLEELLIIFRKKIEQQFTTLRKTFFVLDPKADGFVDLDVLHQILNQFVFPMTPNIFKQLLEKCAFRATGKISWLHFLQKFQDPQSKHLNGSSITIKSDHKCNPIHGVNNKSNIKELLQLLYKYINNNYISFRKAFLQLNKTHKGKISKITFKKILQQFQFHIPSEQFDMIYAFLDPEKNGYITYHHFLEIFEQKENANAHKWLNSNHKVVEPQNISQMSSETIKSTLTENILKNWKSVICEFKSYDIKGSGLISLENLKKIFTKLFGYLKDDDVDRLVASLTLKDNTGKINYLELLNALNIDPSPTDLEGLSSQIIESNEIQVKDRHENHMEKMDFIDKMMVEKVNSMSTEELIVRIKDRFLQSGSNYYEIYRKFECPDKRGGINRQQLRKVLNEFGFSVSLEQFSHLCQLLNFPKYRLDFNGFQSIFLDNRDTSNSLNNSICYLPKSNHHVNDIRGDEGREMSSVEIEELLRHKIVNNFSDLLTTFHKFDENKKGFLTRSDFRKVLSAFLLKIDENQFDLLCQNLGIETNSKITYKDFLDRFQIKDDMIRGHKWLTSNHKFNDISDNVEQEMTAEQVYLLLPEKIYQTFQSLSPAFTHLVTNGTGYIRFKNIQQLLDEMHIKISKSECKKLWKKYDIHNRNKLDYHDFLFNMGLLEKFTVGDTGGSSSKIIQNSHNTVVHHLAQQEEKHQTILDNQAMLGNHMSVEHLFNLIKRHLQQVYSDNKSAFKAITNKKTLTGLFSLNDLNRLLSQIHLFVTNEKFMQLAARIGFESPNDSLPYEKFSIIFQDPVNIAGHEYPIGVVKHDNDINRPSKIIVRDTGNMTNNEISAFIVKKITSQFSDIEKTFHVMDPQNIGSITVDEFRNLLTGFCLSLTDIQFKKYIDSLSVYVSKNDRKEERFDYRYFLQGLYQKNNGNAHPSLVFLSSESNPENLIQMNFKQILDYISESIIARPTYFLNFLKLKDQTSSKFISKSDFRSVIEEFIYKLSDEDFDKYWNHQPRNEFDNLNYVEFIRKLSGYSEDEIGKILKNGSSKEKSTDILNPWSNIDENEEAFKNNLENLLNKHWQAIFNKCRALDNSANDSKRAEGSISIYDFISILSEYSNAVTSEKLESLNLYKTCRSGGNIRYGDLIRRVVLNSRGSLITHENLTEIQKKFANVGIKTTNSDNTKDYFSQMLKLRRQILENWKDLRKNFLNLDKKQNGTVSGDSFMMAMKTVCGQLNADLFYHLMKLYYCEEKGDFHYKKFIEDFLKTA